MGIMVMRTIAVTVLAYLKGNLSFHSIPDVAFLPGLYAVQVCSGQRRLAVDINFVAHVL